MSHQDELNARPVLQVKEHVRGMGQEDPEVDPRMGLQGGLDLRPLGPGLMGVPGSDDPEGGPVRCFQSHRRVLQEKDPIVRQTMQDQERVVIAGDGQDRHVRSQSSKLLQEPDDPTAQDVLPVIRLEVPTQQKRLGVLPSQPPKPTPFGGMAPEMEVTGKDDAPVGPTDRDGRVTHDQTRHGQGMDLPPGVSVDDKAAEFSRYQPAEPATPGDHEPSSSSRSAS
jgi:hypothetical protein